jgi:hypothetical protein
VAVRPNARLIPINKGAVRTLTSTFCGVIAREAKLYLKEHPGEGETPLALLEDRFYANRTFEVENHRTKRGYDLDLRAEEASMPQSQINDLLAGVEMHCPGDIMGGHLAVGEDVHTAYRQEMVVNLCPLLTVEALTLVDVAYEAAAFQEDMYSLLLHELTHASEYGQPKNYKTVAADAPANQAKGTEKEYLNHPWEVRANARQIAAAVVATWKKASRPVRVKRGGKYVKDEGLIPSMLASGYTLDDVISGMRWGDEGLEMREEKRFNRVWKHYTAANKKKLLQLIVRELQEEELI